MSEELKIKSFRISEDTTDKFRSICADFDNQNTALSALISAYEIQNAKAVLTTRQTELEDYDVHLQALQRAFLQSLELNSNAEERIRNEFARQLDTKDKTIADYQTRIDELEGLLKATKEKCDNDTKNASDKLSEALRDVTEANKSIDKLSSELQSAKATVQDKLAIIDGLTARVPETEKLQAELKEKDAAIEKANTQHVVEKTELNNKILGLNNTITSLNSEIEKLKTAAELAEQKHQLELEKAVVDARAESIKEFEEARKKYDDARIKALEAKAKYESQTAN